MDFVNEVITKYICPTCGSLLTRSGLFYESKVKKIKNKYKRKQRKKHFEKPIKKNSVKPYASEVEMLFRLKKKSSEKRGLYWGLTLEEFESLSYQNCHYCGLEPSNKRKDQNKKTSGLDRVDNEYGYYLENVVPCCKICNMWKGTMSLSEFYNHIKKITKKQKLVK